MSALSRRRAPTVALIAIVVLLCVGIRLGGAAQEQATPDVQTPSATADVPGGPATCRVGLALTSVHSIDLINGAFDADFWIWSVCLDDRYTPLTTMEFVNANAVVVRLAGETVVDDVTWVYAKVSGTFRHRWDLSTFPFDQQALRIEMEDTANVAADFAYEPDTTDPIPGTEIGLEDWRVAGATLDVGTQTYRTTYGDPRQPMGSTDYSRLVLTVTFERDDLTSLFKFTFVVYIAVLISLISYFLPMHDATMLIARISIISGTLFAVAVSMGRATSELSTEEGLTLIDAIHIAALAAILVDAMAALITQLLIERRHPPERLNRFNRTTMVVVVVGFVAVNAWLIGAAAIG